MKIKVGNKTYDGNDTPIMVILENRDKENIKNMLSHCTKYCVFPDSYHFDDIEKWMSTE